MMNYLHSAVKWPIKIEFVIEIVIIFFIGARRTVEHTNKTNKCHKQEGKWNVPEMDMIDDLSDFWAWLKQYIVENA